MCNFFKRKEAPPLLIAGGLFVPFLSAVLCFYYRNEDLGAFALSWLLGSAATAYLGYEWGKSQPCLLPHLAEDVVVNEDAVDDEQEGVEMVAMPARAPAP